MKISLCWIVCLSSMQVYSQNIFDSSHTYFEDDITIYHKLRINTGLEIKNPYWPPVNVLALSRATDIIENKNRNLNTGSHIPLIAQRNFKKGNEKKIYNIFDQIIFRDDDDEDNAGTSGTQTTSKVTTTNIIKVNNEDANQNQFVGNNDFIPLLSQNFNNFHQNPANAYPTFLDLEVFHTVKTSTNEKKYQYFNNVKFDNENKPIKEPDQNTPVPENVDVSEVVKPSVSNLTSTLSQDLDLSIFNDATDTLNIDLSVFNASATSVPNIDLSVFDGNATNDGNPVSGNQDTADNLNAVTDNIELGGLDLSVFESAENNNTSTTAFSWNLDLSIYDQFKKDFNSSLTDTS